MVSAKEVVYNTIGTTGVILILIMYFAIQLHKLDVDDLSYSLLNLLGAGLIGVSLIFRFNLPSALIEVSWIAISFFGAVRWVLRKRRERKSAATASDLGSSGALDSDAVPGGAEPESTLKPDTEKDMEGTQPQVQSDTSVPLV